MSRRTEMAYKAQSPGKVAPFDSAQGALSLPNGHDIPNPGFRRPACRQTGRVVAGGDQECRGCVLRQAQDMMSLPNHVATVHVLIRGDLSNGAACIATGVGLRAISKGMGLPPNPTAIMAAHHVVTHGVSGQKSAEVIVAKCPG